MRRAIVLVGVVLGLAACDSITGNNEPWVVNGLGNDVVDRPRGVERVRVTGAYAGRYQNFIVECGRSSDENWDLVVNEILGTESESTRYEGTHLLERGCGPFVISHSDGVAWTITKVN